jgi:hypothetical protein
VSPPITLIIVRPREDVARTFEHRRGAYVDFYEALRDMIFLIYNHGMGLSDEPEDQVDDEPGDDEFGTLPFDFQLTTFRKLQHLRLYAAPLVAHAATEAYNAAWRWGQPTRYGQDDDRFYERQAAYDEKESALLNAIRSDLRIPAA